MDKKYPKWDQLKWYQADDEYHFSLVKALVKCKNGECQVRAVVKKGEWYIPMPLIEELPKEDYSK